MPAEEMDPSEQDSVSSESSTGVGLDKKADQLLVIDEVCAILKLTENGENCGNKVGRKKGNKGVPLTTAEKSGKQKGNPFQGGERGRFLSSRSPPLPFVR